MFYVSNLRSKQRILLSLVSSTCDCSPGYFGERKVSPCVNLWIFDFETGSRETERLQYLVKVLIQASIYDRETISRRFETVHNILRSLSLAKAEMRKFIAGRTEI